MHLMVLLRNIYLCRDNEGYVPFIHLSLHYVFLSILHWGLKYPLIGNQIQSLLQLWLLFSLRLNVLVLSSNMIKGWTFSLGIYITYLHIHITGSLFWCLIN